MSVTQLRSSASLAPPGRAFVLLLLMGSDAHAVEATPDEPAPAAFYAAFSTSVGTFHIRANRSWSPLGVDRLFGLLRRGHYDDTRIYRVVPGWVAQFGYSGDPSVQRAQTVIPDDPIGLAAHNRRGFLSYSASYTANMGHATNRTTELYVNYADHLQLDRLGFTPIAEVVGGGMAVVDAFHSGYGELRDACGLHGFRPCEGPVESRILAEGNAYLDADFPRLTRIVSAAVVSEEAVAARPARIELHCHLDGSVPPETLLRVARRRKLVLPGIGRVPQAVGDVWASLRSMGPIWRWFDLVNEIIGGDAPTLTEVAEDFVRRQAAQGIAYTEVRWDPVRPSASRLANASIAVEEAVAAVAKGLAAGAARHAVAVHQILCAMRGSPEGACYDLARLAAKVRSGAVGGVVGIDLAGDELHFNNTRNGVEGCFRYAKAELRLNATVHAGEMADDEYADVASAVLDMRADRVGHGYAAARHAPTLQMLARRGVHLEACPAGHHDNLHATGVYREAGLRFGLSTDDPAAYFGNVTMGDVEALVRQRLGFTTADILRAHADAYAAAFAPSAARVVAAQQREQREQRAAPYPAIPDASELLWAAMAMAALVLVGTVAKRGWRRWGAHRKRRKREVPAELVLPATEVMFK